MAKLLILDDYTSSAHAFADWSRLTAGPHALDVTVLTRAVAPSDLVETLKPYPMIHLMRERTKLSRATLAELPALRFITTTGLKNRGIDLDACRDLGIVVCGTDSLETRTASGTVEQTWALILALSRRIVLEHSNLRRGPASDSSPPPWQTGVAVGLRGKTIGLIGLGRLGTRVAHVANAFGMDVVAWSPNLTPDRARAAAAPVDVEVAPSLDALLARSDVVSVHLVLSDSTRGILGRAELGRMKRSAYLVNTSRGPLVDERALVDALRDGTIAGAGLDVFDLEPLPHDHPLRSLENVVLSPHMGYVETPQYETWWKQTVDNVESYLEGNPVRLLQ
ncbi:hypothetical protein JCM11491_001405 [Sporobolomyces phaffii]